MVSYTVTPTFTNNSVSCTGSGASVSIVVNPIPVVSTTVSTQTICSGTSTNVIATNNTTGGTNSFVWGRTLPSGITGTGSLTNASLAQTLTSTNTSPTSVSYTVTPSFTNNSVSCTGSGASVSIIVNPIPAVSTTVSTQTICSGTSTNVIASNNTTGGTNSFVWSRTLPGGITGTGSLTNASLAETLTTTNTSPTSVSYAVTPSFTNNSVSCTGSGANVNIVVNPISTSSIFSYICQNDSLIFNGIFLKNQGIYFDTFFNLLGCDSIVTLNLMVKPTSSYSFSQSICQGSSFLFNGNNLNTSGTYFDTITNYVGCDSIVTLNLMVKPISSYSFSQSICQGTTFLFNGNNLNTSGTYFDTLTNYVGCDSVVKLNLIVKALPPIPTVSVNLCTITCDSMATAYQWDSAGIIIQGATSQTLTVFNSGIYSVTITDANGCNNKSTPTFVNCNVGINNVSLDESILNIIPNPCVTCELIVNTTVSADELQITDLLGKKVEAIFIQSAKGYLIDMLQNAGGIYFIRNIKTGKVTKFVKE